MPVTSSATQALRKDRRRTEVNAKLRSQVRTAINHVQLSPNPENLANAYSIIDRAAKKNIFHPNKAARLKKALALKVKSTSQSVKSKPKPAPKKLSPQKVTPKKPTTSK